MDKKEIKDSLLQAHQSFLSDIAALSAEEATNSFQGKWSALQQLEHIVKSVAPVTLAFGLPAFLVKWKFGKANRPSRTYDELVARYHSKLAAGGTSTPRFLPAATGDRRQLMDKLDRLTKQLARRIDRYSETQLDQLILPHPLLGKLTFLEMLYFTNYHVGHHHQQVIQHIAQLKHR